MISRSAIRRLCSCLCAAVLAGSTTPAAAQLTFHGIAWGTSAEQARTRLVAQGYRFRGADQEGDLVFWGPLRAELVVTVAPSGVVAVEEEWPGTLAQVRARFRAQADSVRRALGPPTRTEEMSAAWERGGAYLSVWYTDRAPALRAPQGGISARGPGFDAEIDRRSDLERAEDDRIERGVQARDTLLVGDWMRAYSDTRVLASFDSSGTVRVSPGVYRTRFRESWMFTRRLENGIKYTGAVREVEIDCRTLRERLLRTVFFYTRRAQATVEVPPAQRRWSTPAAASAEGREIRRACQLSGAGRG
jgi:hypothetical protein